MSSVPLFIFGCVVFVIVMTAVFLFGLTQFDAWEKRDDALSDFEALGD